MISVISVGVVVWALLQGYACYRAAEREKRLARRGEENVRDRIYQA